MTWAIKRITDGRSARSRYRCKNPVIRPKLAGRMGEPGRFEGTVPMESTPLICCPSLECSWPRTSCKAWLLNQYGRSLVRRLSWRARSGLYTSRRGKFLAWTELLDQLNLRGDERILDLGCGRGAVLLLAAQRLTTGRAVGVDVWRRGDQSGNAAMATRRNALAEGVADRIELHTADMTGAPLRGRQLRSGGV